VRAFLEIVRGIQKFCEHSRKMSERSWKLYSLSKKLCEITWKLYERSRKFRNFGNCASFHRNCPRFPENCARSWKI
jgi:hypothetical protein